ncbi:MAG: hypothetical protein H6R00_2027 [Proteobacteria bacterium]|nr:hypothetical protein [Pseudomonadota bacterium]
MRAEATIERRPSGNQAIDDLDALIAELIAVIDDENALLASGMPASLAATTGRKSNLASNIEASLKAISAAAPGPGKSLASCRRHRRIAAPHRRGRGRGA